MKTPRLHRLLPPNLVALTVIGMVALRVFSIGPEVIEMPLALLGVAPLGAGIYVNVSNALRFSRLGTNIVTFGDPGRLVDDGWFARTRNPMYVGFVLILVGVALLLGTAVVWAGPVAFFAAANWWYIPFEERRMAANFGTDYERYRAGVRRWF